MGDPTPGREARAREIAALLVEAVKTQNRLDTLYSSLSTAPDPDGPREQLADSLRADRREALYRLGLAAFHAHLAGAKVSLSWPEDRVASDPEPAIARTNPAPRGLAQPTQGTSTPQPAAPRAAAAPPEELLLLAHQGLGPNWESQREPTDRALALHAVLDALGGPEPAEDEPTVLAEARRIAREADRLERWLSLDRASQQLLLSYSAAKARYLQERARDRYDLLAPVAGLDPAFRAMNRYAKEHRPGFVWGLSRTQPPKHGTWADDARRYWHELQELAGRSPHLETNPERALSNLQAVLARSPSDEAIREAAVGVLAAGVSPQDPRLLKLLEPVYNALEGRSLRPVRRALRQAFDASDEDTEEVPVLPPDWPCYEWTRGRVAVVVGGDRRAEAADRLRQVFGFSEVLWDSDVQGTKLSTVVERIRHGSIHMVLFLARLSSHSSQAVLLEACKHSGAPFIRVERGYGAGSVRTAIELFHGQTALT